MNDPPGKREDTRPLDPQEIKKGLSVWVQLNKKGARVAATIRDHTEDRSRCTVDLEIDDPLNSGRVIRQAYPKQVHVYQLTRREAPAPADMTPEPEVAPAPQALSESQTPEPPAPAIRNQEEQTEGSTGCAAPPDGDRTRLLSELLDLGRCMEYRLLVLGASHPDDAICIRPGLQSWATYGVDLDTARLRVAVAATRRYYGHLRSAGLAKEPEQAVTALFSTPALAPEIQDRQDDQGQELDDLDSLTVYGRESLTYQGPQDRARRAWLKQWAEQHNYPAYWFTLYDRYSGYYQAGVPAGIEGWSGILERATHYDIYCCFVAALERHPLKHYLNDAAQRGEMKLDIVVT